MNTRDMMEKLDYFKRESQKLSLKYYIVLRDERISRGDEDSPNGYLIVSDKELV